jgi:hypothetical protein
MRAVGRGGTTERTGILAAVTDGVAALEASVWSLAEVLVTGDLLVAERALQRLRSGLAGLRRCVTSSQLVWFYYTEATMGTT